MKKILHTSLIAVLPMGYAWADTVSNFTNAKNALCKPFAVSQSVLYAGSFTTGGNAGGYKLDDVVWSVVSVNIIDQPGLTPGGKFEVKLWESDGLGNPGVAIETLSGPSVPALLGGTLKPGLDHYKSTLGTILDPNKTYWVSATVVGGNDLRVRLERTDLPTEVSNPAGWSIGDTSFTLDSSDPNDDPKIIKDSCLPYLTIVATPVPEPSTIALLGLTGAGLLLISRRRN